MKNVLLSIALLASASVCNAQELKVGQPAVKAQAVKATVLNAPIAPAKMDAPRKTRQSGVYYERPEGLWYCGYSFGSDGSMAALHSPALCEYTFVNGCLNPSAATWSINGTDISSYADEDNNLPWSYSGVDNEYGYNAYYAPALSSDGEDFTITDIMYVAANESPIQDYNPALATIYTGFTDGPAWGTGSVLEEAISSQVTGVDGFVGYRKDFEKPISPLYVTSISMPAMSNKEDALGGNALTATIYRLNDDGSMESEPAEVLTCSNIESEYNSSLDAYYASEIQFSKSTVNEFGDEEAAPIVIDYPFALVLSGFNQTGVDVQLFLADLSGDDYEFDNANPTRVLTQIGEDVYGYYWKGTSQGQNYFYSMPINFNGLYDNVVVSTKGYSTDGTAYDGANYVEVSTDGQTCSNYLYSDAAGAVVSTATPWFDEDGNENYYSEDLPDWISAISAENLDAENYPCEYVVSFMADALPEGVTGRGAFVHITGRGVVSEDNIFVYQGDIEAAWNMAEEAAGVKNVTVEPNAVNNGKTYNVAGQIVDNNYKGIVIKNGKKMLMK